MAGKMRPRTTTAPILIVTSLLVIGGVSAASADRPQRQGRQGTDRYRSTRTAIVFEDQKGHGKLKRSILRGPHGEVNVGEYLDDLQANVDKMKDRFTPAVCGRRRKSRP